MRLRNSATITAAITAVQYLRMQLDNARNQGLGADAHQDAFLAWCDNHARPYLRNCFASTEDLHAELDGSYDRIALAPQMSERRMNGLTHRECAVWEDRLDRLLIELFNQQKLAERPGRPVVLDTSVLMESKPAFTNLDWRSVDSSLTEGIVRLIVPILVVEELDDLLHDRDGERRRKARATTRSLRNLHGFKPTEPAALTAYPDVTIEVLLDGDWHQRRPNNDGEIIDQALQLSELTGQPVLLASCDTRQLYRGGAAGLAVVLIPRGDEI
jgi:hypothetical protein